MNPSNVSLAKLITQENRIDELQGTTPDRVVAELLAVAAEHAGLDEKAQSSIRRSILARERAGTTGIGNGIAIPHHKDCGQVSEILAIFGRSRAGVDYGATDGEAVHVFFLVLTPPGHESEHVQLMKRIVILSRDRNTMQHLIQAPELNNLREIFEEVDAQVG